MGKKDDVNVETRDVSDMADAIAGTKTTEATVTDRDGNSATARGNSSEQATDRATESLNKK